MVVGRLLSYWVSGTFQGRAVKLREDIRLVYRNLNRPKLGSSIENLIQPKDNEITIEITSFFPVTLLGIFK